MTVLSCGEVVDQEAQSRTQRMTVKDSAARETISLISSILDQRQNDYWSEEVEKHILALPFPWGALIERGTAENALIERGTAENAIDGAFLHTRHQLCPSMNRHRQKWADHQPHPCENSQFSEEYRVLFFLDKV